MAYLEARAIGIPNEWQRRIERKYIGSGHAEKANDLFSPDGRRGEACTGARRRVMRLPHCAP